MHRPRPRAVFLPPIMQVLEEGQYRRFYTEGVSNVIKWVDLDSVQLSSPTKKEPRPKTPLSHLMKTIDLRHDDEEEEEEGNDHDDPQKDGKEHFSYIVCFPEEAAPVKKKDQRSSYAQTAFTQRPIPSSQGPRPSPFYKNNVFTGLMKAARIVMPARMVHASDLRVKF